MHHLQATMKKTLFLIPLLAGVTVAEDATNNSDADRVIYTSHVTYGTDGYANITTQHGTHNIQMSNPSFTCADAATGSEVNYLGTTHTMGVDVGSGGGFVLTLDFPVSSSYDEYTISNISLALGLNNFEGTTYPLAGYMEANGGLAPRINVEIFVRQQDTQLAHEVYEYTYYNSGSNQYTFGFNYGDGYKKPEIELRGAFTLEIRIDGNVGVEQAPFYVSVDNVEVSGNAPRNYTIPEPTTTTLSLLALAGLAARRRRK